MTLIAHESPWRKGGQNPPNISNVRPKPPQGRGEKSTMQKTIGNLIDELSITNLKIWKQEDIKRESSTLQNSHNLQTGQHHNTNLVDSVVANATRKTNILNQQRNDLIQAIDEQINHMVKTGELQKLYGQGECKSYGE